MGRKCRKTISFGTAAIVRKDFLMTDIFIKLIEQLPSAAAIIVVVVYFIRYIQRRDEQERDRSNKTLEILSGLSVLVNTVSAKQDAHHIAMMDAVNDMRNATRRRKNDAKSSD